MIALPTGTRVWLAAGVTDMRKGMDGLVQTAAGARPLRRPRVRVPGSARRPGQTAVVDPDDRRRGRDALTVPCEPVSIEEGQRILEERYRLAVLRQKIPEASEAALGLM